MVGAGSCKGRVRLGVGRGASLGREVGEREFFFSIYPVENAGNFIEVLWEGLERSNAQAREAPLAELLDPRQN